MHATRVVALFLVLATHLVGPSYQSVMAADSPSVLGLTLGANREETESIFEQSQINKFKVDDENEEIAFYASTPKRIADGGPVMLIFHEDKLVKIVLLIDVESQQARPYVSRYLSLKASLTKKYGKPKQEVEHMDSDYAKYPLLAIKTGKSVYNSLWETGELTIGLSLTGDNYEVKFNLQYEYDPLFDKYLKSKDDEEASNL